MSNLRKALSEADENYFIGLSNKGIYKRACKDLTSADVSVEYQEEEAEIHINGETCRIKEPLYESSCSCPSREVCRHLISAMLWLKENYQSDDEESGFDDEPDYFEEEVLPEGLPELLRQALSQVTVPQLKKAMGSQMKFILNFVDKIQLEESSILSGMLPDRTAVRLLYPLQNSTCACHKKDLCQHKAAVVLAWQWKEHLISLSDFEIQVKTLTEQESIVIRESAERSSALLCDVLKWGLVRMPENMAEHLEAAAVQSHALRMADAERMLRDLGSKLSDCRQRRAIFHAEHFLNQFCECADYLNIFRNETISEPMLGQFRRSYETFDDNLSILPIGQRSVNSSDYAGEIYYFLNLDENAEDRFLTFSDIRPVFYETKTHFKRHDTVIPWNAGVPMKALMKSKMILSHAKISDGKLSSSQETTIIMKTAANLNCREIQKLIFTDFRKIAVDLGTRPQDKENLYFIHPAKCISSVFDTHSQKYQMQIADEQENIILIQVRYQSETKEFINLLEKIGKEMLDSPDMDYTWLCSAYFENGRLCLFPIEIYNFIDIPRQEEYRLPSSYAQTNPEHASQILNLLEDVQSYLCELLQSGLHSARHDSNRKLSETAKNSGMQGLSDLLMTFRQSAEQFRHSMQEDMTALMQNYIAVQKYVTIGLEKLELLCALDNMKKV